MIKIIKYTDNPLTSMGEVASICWDSTPRKEIGIDCIESGHGRVLEYVDVILSIENYSARMIRELYTTMAGVSKLQSSTRYINYDNFNYYTPPKIESEKEAFSIYNNCMDTIKESYNKLIEIGIPKEDIANILPLGMMTKVVLKINLRALLHLFEIRTCTRTYIEYRKFMKELKSTLKQLDYEWAYIINNFAKTKCEIMGYCTEKKGCGRYGKKKDL